MKPHQFGILDINGFPVCAKPGDVLLQAKLFKYEKGRKEGSQCTVIRRLRQSQASTGDDMNSDIYAAGI